ncbi:MAG: TerC family protein [Flavobacteriaceae bacterium]
MTPDVIIAFLTLTFLEVVLGIDNIIFISILASKFPEKNQKKLMQTGLALAMIMRILLLLGINWLIHIQTVIISIDRSWFNAQITLQSLILLVGGLFLLYKSTHEIYQKVETVEALQADASPQSSVFKALIQIVLIDLVFSFDSILTAVGMTNGIPFALWIMIGAIVLSILIMIGFAGPINQFINNHPSIQILGLSFLLLIGFMLITEAAHLSNTSLFGSTIGSIPKGYLYFAIAFSLGVEMINMKLRKR